VKEKHETIKSNKNWGVVGVVKIIFNIWIVLNGISKIMCG